MGTVTARTVIEFLYFIRLLVLYFFCSFILLEIGLESAIPLDCASPVSLVVNLQLFLEIVLVYFHQYCRNHITNKE